MIVIINYVDVKSNNVNSSGENIIAINLKLFHFSLLKIVEIEFKMKLESFFWFGIFLRPTKNDFSYLAPHLSEWNESKLSMFI